MGLGRQGAVGLRAAIVGTDSAGPGGNPPPGPRQIAAGAPWRQSRGARVALIVLGALALWGFSGFFRVEPDELGVVLRFGKEVREVQPGLNYHLPYPIETVLTPKALRVNKIDIGMRVVDDIRRGGTTVRDVPEESLMLTGDENIVDVDFSVLWKVKPTGVGEFLFNIQNPEGTVKAVAESAMREVIGRSEIQPILTGARQTIETAVQDLMQKTLDHYGAGIILQQVQLQKVDPPAQVIDAFRDVQAARADLERAVNEAQTYANRVVPEARGRVAQITQAAEAYRQQTVAEATGQTSVPENSSSNTKKRPTLPASACISKPWNVCSAAPTRSFWILEQAAAAWCLLSAQRAHSSATDAKPITAGRPAMRLNFVGGIIAVLSRRADHRLFVAVHGLSDPAGAGGSTRTAGARG